MGEWAKPRNMRWGDRTESQIEALQQSLWPDCQSRSAAVRWAVNFAHEHRVTGGSVPRLSEATQGARCTQFVRTPGPGKPGPYYWRGIAPTEREARDFMRAIHEAAA